ncbi:MAG: aldo/keto reductase [Bifidobacteriaceae bacterium]|jgi:diketogulonate reductase-like aldo/keto reductase|nr:aldo/keto reductase [Bifidobacteriaceae bacterium]
MSLDIPSRQLNDGRSIPVIGFGTYGLNRDEDLATYLAAFDAGYRLVDTARCYGNEPVVGRAVAEADLPREELLVQSKLIPKEPGYKAALAQFEASRRQLGLDYIDVYLIHWPNPKLDAYVETWKAMIHLRDAGLIRSIGVSNFTTHHLVRLREETGVTPAVNQIERHPWWPNQSQVAADRELGVVTQSWSPLGSGKRALDDPVIARVARAHEVSPAQVVLRWQIQAGCVPIPISRQPANIQANLDVFGFRLSYQEVKALDEMKSGRLESQDPDTTNYIGPLNSEEQAAWEAIESGTVNL